MANKFLHQSVLFHPNHEKVKCKFIKNRVAVHDALPLQLRDQKFLVIFLLYLILDVPLVF